MTPRIFEDYLDDIWTAILDIEKFTDKTDMLAFIKDKRTYLAVVRCLEIIGEAAGQVGKEISDSHPEIPWSEMRGMRNKLIHNYFGIDEDIVWKVVKEEIPALKPSIKRLRSDLGLEP
jgi:uncharacterized protein with HEPN domain